MIKKESQKFFLELGSTRSFKLGEDTENFQVGKNDKPVWISRIKSVGYGYKGSKYGIFVEIDVEFQINNDEYERLINRNGLNIVKGRIKTNE